MCVNFYRSPASPCWLFKRGSWARRPRRATGRRTAAIPAARVIRRSPKSRPQNVARLQRAWVYHTGEVIPNFEVTPVMVDNVLYFSTPTQRVVALDATKGTEIWTFEPNPKVAKLKEHRGVSYWPGDARHGRASCWRPPTPG